MKGADAHRPVLSAIEAWTPSKPPMTSPETDDAVHPAAS